MATRSSSACVALINMRFMVVPCALHPANTAGARNAGAFRLETSCRRPRTRAAPGLVFQRYDTTAGRGSALSFRMCCGAGGSPGPALGQDRGAARDMFSQPASDWPGAVRGRWAVAVNINAPGAVVPRGPIRGKVGFRPGLPSAVQPASGGNSPRNQNLTSLRECIRPREPMAHSDSRPNAGGAQGGAGGGVRLVRVPDDRAGQRLDNFLLGQLKGAPRSLVYKIVRSGQVRV